MAPRPNRYALIMLIVVALIGLGYLIYKSSPDANTPQSQLTDNNGNATTTSTGDQTSDTSKPVVLAQDLDIPWEVAFIEEDGFLVTERPGHLVRITSDGRRLITVDGVRPTGEGGLLGLALHPKYKENGYIYLYLTSESGTQVVNRVERYKYDDSRNQLSDRKVIISDIPGSRNHDGGRIAFGPDGNLYIATGDAGNSSLAQDRNSLAGKILRVHDDGTVPDDNPFGSPIWTYGHRNPEGLAWDGEGRMWATEHGRSGAQSGLDELNLIVKGNNYGWPDIEGDQMKEGMQNPVINSGEKSTWAPAGLAYLNGRLFFGGLRGEALYSVSVSGDGRVSDFKTHYQGLFGRIRAVVAWDGELYITTSNRDGRGAEKEGDDKVIRLPLDELFN
ncbi:MAG: PQQ-dependent sugar dehydrogenase [Bacillota bacterium]